MRQPRQPRPRSSKRIGGRRRVPTGRVRRRRRVDDLGDREIRHALLTTGSSPNESPNESPGASPKMNRRMDGRTLVERTKASSGSNLRTRCAGSSAGVSGIRGHQSGWSSVGRFLFRVSSISRSWRLRCDLSTAHSRSEIDVSSSTKPSWRVIRSRGPATTTATHRCAFNGVVGLNPFSD